MKSTQHIAIICDGNRRWAKRKNKSEFTGHKYAVQTTAENLVDYAIKLKIPYITFWFFSTENWNRGPAWIKNFFKLFRDLIPQATDKYIAKGAKFNTIGDLSKLPKDIQIAFNNWINKSKKITKSLLPLLLIMVVGMKSLGLLINFLKTNLLLKKIFINI